MDERIKFNCEMCKFTAKSNSSLEIHLLTKKHIRNTQPIPQNECKRFNCKTCDKSYKYATGLSAHAKICRQENSLQAVNEKIMMSQIMKITERLEQLHPVSTTVNHNNISNNISNNTINNFNINLFLNETCKDAINLDMFIKNLIFELADTKLMIGSYVDGTCNIIKKNLEVIPINKRPLHYLEGEDPYQQLMHIREDNKWKIGTELNWMKQIHADDDDDVIDKNPIYYALKTIDDEKLKYLAYNFNHDKEYKIQQSRLQREISRVDLKSDVYNKTMNIIKLDTSKL